MEFRRKGNSIFSEELGVVETCRKYSVSTGTFIAGRKTRRQGRWFKVTYAVRS
jgi:hypothetical protein